MEEFLIEPIFSRANNAIYFETERLNALQRAEYQDKLGFYQATFGVYSYMQLTSKLKYKIHYPEGLPLVWQEHNSCAWTPLGNLSWSNKEIEPCNAKVNEQFCYDEFFNSTYEEFLSWSSNPTIGFSNAGRIAVDELVRTIVKNATLGARMTLTAGKLFEETSFEYVEGTSTSIQNAFQKTANVCRGWMQLAIDGSATASHLNNNEIDSGDISTDGKSYEGSVTTLYDSMLAAAPSPLYDAIIEGGASGFAGTTPLALVSPSIYRKIDLEWKAQKSSAMMNMPRIERRTYNYNGREMRVFFIDDTAIIPITDVNQYTKHMTGTAHFMYLTMPGVIQLGGSFGALPVANETEVAVMMQVGTDVEDLGTHKFLSHALFATAFNDTDYITGDFVYATPA